MIPSSRRPERQQRDPLYTLRDALPLGDSRTLSYVYVCTYVICIYVCMYTQLYDETNKCTYRSTINSLYENLL